MKTKEEILKSKAGTYQFTNGWTFEDSQNLTKAVLDAMEEYAEQFTKAPSICSLQINSELKRNKYVVYIGGRESKYLTVGKKYRLTCELWESLKGDIMISVINDKGNRYVTKANCFRLQCP